MTPDEQKVVDDYPWPCEKRTAHGGHSPDGKDWCPGVKAHPLTQIGRTR